MKRRLLVFVPLLATLLILLSPFVSLLPAGSSTVYAANRADSVCRNLIVQGTGASPSDVKDSTLGFSDCKTGYNTAYNDPSQTNAAKPTGPCDLSIRDTKSNLCEAGFKQGLVDGKADKGTQLTAAQIKAAAEKACNPWKVESGVSSSDQTKNFNACVVGYTGEKNGKSLSDSCDKYTGFEQRACYTGHDSATNGQAVKPTAGGAGAVTSSSSAPTNPSGDTNDKQLGCDFNANPLSWIICPVIDTLVALISAIDNLITQQLTVNTDKIFCTDGKTCQDYYQAWQSFRNIALGLMVIAGLVVVTAQALGVEVLDAYTLRKTLPRILIAAVGITLSWPLMQFLVILTNDLGFGIRHLIYAPFKNLSDTLQIGQSAGEIFFGAGTTAALAGASAGGAAAGAVLFTMAGGIGAMLGYVGTAALAVFIAIVVLALRQVAIILMMLLAPIAIVSYILPNTQKIYQFWWDAFTKALLMFPLIAAFIATGRVFSAIAINSGGFLNQIIGFFAYFAPYFLIPLTFKFAGGFVRQLGGFVNDRSKGGFDQLRNFRATRRQKGRQRIMAGNLYKGAADGTRKKRLNEAYQSIGLGVANTDDMGSNPLKWRSRARMLRVAADLNNSDKVLQSDEFKPYLGDDDFGRAVLDSGGTVDGFRRSLRATGKFTNESIEQKAAGYELMRNKFGDSALEQAALSSSLMASTFLEPGASGQLLDYIDKIAKGSTQTKAQLIGKAKDIAPKNGRPGLVAPFSDMWGQLEAIGNATTPEARQAAIEHASEYLADVNTDVEGPAFWFTGKGRDTEGGIPSIQRKIKRAADNVVAIEQNGGQPITITRLNGSQDVLTEEQAHSEMVQVMAEIAGTADNLPAVSAEKKRLYTDGVLRQQIPGFKTTVVEEIDQLSTDPQFAPEFTLARSRYERAMALREAEARQIQARQLTSQQLANMNPEQRAAYEARQTADALAQAQAAEAARRAMGENRPLDPGL